MKVNIAIKGKVVIEHYAMKAYGGVDVWIHVLLNSALAGDELSASHHGRITPADKAPGTYWIGGWMKLRAGLDDVEKRKILPLPDSNSDPSVVQPVASRYSD
jgi:hypothetical protein